MRSISSISFKKICTLWLYVTVRHGKFVHSLPWKITTDLRGLPPAEPATQQVVEVLPGFLGVAKRMWKTYGESVETLPGSITPLKMVICHSYDG